VAAEADRFVRTGVALVVNAEVAVDVEVEQPVDVRATAVIVTTFDAPAVGRVAVVNVPVPEAKVMLAVVDDTVFVPETL
jgi:hypothetical protein